MVQNSGNFSSSLIQSLQDGISVLTAQGLTVEVNSALCRMTGFSREELIGSSPPYPYWPPEEYEAIRRAFEKTLKDEIHTFELVFMKKNGQRFPVMVTPSSVKNEAGQITHYVGTVKDVTEQKKTENALKENEERYRILIENAPEALVVFDLKKQKFIVVSDSAATLFKMTKEELLHVGVKEVSPELQPNGRRSDEAALEKINEAIAGGKPTFEWTHQDSTGRQIPCEVHLVYLPSKEKSIIRGSIQDISKRKQVEANLLAAKQSAERIARMKSNFLDTAAHELRTPVAAFSILLQLSQKRLDQGHPVDSETLARLRTQADRISHLVIDLLEVSRLERGLVTLDRKWSSISDVIRDSIEEAKLRAKNRIIRFRDSPAPLMIPFDALRIHQVISNLLNNALKYTSEAIEIEVSVEQKEKTVRVLVADQGPGISEELKPNLFTPFARSGSEMPDGDGGLGLGLFICRSIVELHGGSIGFNNHPSGRGSVFYFELPNGVDQ